MSTEHSDGTLRARIDALSDRVVSFVDDHALLVLLGPPLGLLLALFVYPVLWMGYESLFVTFPGLERRFEPLYNYERLLESDEFRTYFRQTLLYSVGSLAVSFSSGLALALAIDHVGRRWLRGVYTTLLMFSWAIPLAVFALMWKWALAGNAYGLANMLLLDLGLVDGPVSFFADPTLALVSVTLVDGWLRMPFAMLVFLAGLQSIPQHVYDAAAVDGATTFQRFRHVTLAYLRPYAAIVALINWMFAFRAFSIVYPMTEGGPGTATTILAVEIYEEAMVALDFGYGSAMSAVLVAVTAVLAVFYVRVVLERLEE